jgi:nucleotide-binding universal stress UspA family protein
MTLDPQGKSSVFELGSDGPGTILVGVDGSDSSWRALHYAIGLARREASKIVVVYAIRLPATSYAAPGVLYAIDDLSAQLAGDVEAVGRAHDVDIKFVTSDRDPVTALRAASSEHRADLIVVGASEKPSHRFFGSTATRTIKARCCPVIVVP